MGDFHRERCKTEYGFSLGARCRHSIINPKVEIESLLHFTSMFLAVVGKHPITRITTTRCFLFETSRYLLDPKERDKNFKRSRERALWGFSWLQNIVDSRRNAYF